MTLQYHKKNFPKEKSPANGHQKITTAQMTENSGGPAKTAHARPLPSLCPPFARAHCSAPVHSAPQLRSGSAGSPGVGERSGTERSNERERRADIATARGARARFLPARRTFLSSGRVFVFGEGGIFCVRHSFFLFFNRAEGGFFPCGLRFRGCALFLGRCNLQRMCFWRRGNFCRSKSRSGAEG